MIVKDQPDCFVGRIGGVEKLEEFDESIAEPLATIARIGSPLVWLLDVSVRGEHVTRSLTAVNPDLDEPIEPMMLGSMRQLGVRWLAE